MNKFNSGNFLEAAEESLELKTYDGFAMAAESLIIYGEHLAEPSERVGFFLKAMKISQDAIDMEPENPLAYAHLIRSEGRYAQSISTGKALSEGHAEKLKNLLAKILYLDPNSWQGHLGFGAWHTEVVAKGGLPGKLLFGASARQAISHFDKAYQLNLKSILVNLEIAKELLKLNQKKYRTRIRRHLQEAIALPGVNAHENILLKEATELLAALK